MLVSRHDVGYTERTMAVSMELEGQRGGRWDEILHMLYLSFVRRTKLELKSRALSSFF